MPNVVSWFKRSVAGERASGSTALGLRSATLEALEPRVVLTADITAGIDLWTTPVGSSSFSFIENPIPAGFFDPGSLPFEGEIKLSGEPLDQNSGPDIGLSDTIVRRLDDAEFGGVGGTDTVDIQIIALNLVSADPITVTTGTDDELWDVRVTLSEFDPQPIGQMQLAHPTAGGGTFDAEFFVEPKFIFTRVSDPGDVRVLDGVQAPPVLFEGVGPWVNQIPAGSNPIQVGPGVDVDGDGDGNPDGPIPVGSSQFFPGFADSPQVDPPPPFVQFVSPNALHGVMPAQNPLLDFTKVDLLLLDADGDGVPDPGDTIRYQLELISSALAGDTTNINIQDLLPPELQFLQDSLLIGPHASRDIYSTLPDLLLDVPAAQGLLANDFDIDGLTPQSGLSVVPELITTALGGQVLIGADGSFMYTPPAGFDISNNESIGDNFVYTILDSDGLASTGVAIVTFGPRVWFIDSSNPNPGNGGLGFGSFPDPFINPTLLNGPGGVGDVDAPGDIIFVFEGDSQTTPYTDLELEPGQVLLGESAGLTIGGVQIVAPGPGEPVFAVPLGATPAITLASDVRVDSLTIRDTSSDALFGNGVGGTITLDDVDVQDSDATPGAALRLTASDALVTARTANWESNAGIVIDTDLPTGTHLRLIDSSLSTTGNALRVQNTTGATSVTFEGVTVASDDLIVLYTGNTPAVELTLEDVDLSTTAGGGLSLDSGGLHVRGSNSITVTGGSALDLSGGVTLDDGAAGPATFDRISSTDSPNDGIRLEAVSGSLTVTGDISVQGASGRGLSIANSPGIELDNTSGTLRVSNIGSSGLDGVFIDTNPGADIKLGRVEIVTEDSTGLNITASGDITMSGGSIITAGALGVRQEATTVNGRLDQIIVDDSTDSGIFLDGVDGTFRVGRTVVRNPVRHGVRIINSPTLQLDLGRVLITGTGDTATTTDGDGLRIFDNNNGAVLRISSLDLDTERGNGLVAKDVTITFGSPNNSIDAIGGAALDLDNVTFFGTDGPGAFVVPGLVSITPTGEVPGGTLGGTQVTFDATLELQIVGFGDLDGFNRLVQVPLSGVTADYGPRVPGEPVQHFPNEMVVLQGELFGDPDFDLLRITTGSGLAAPLPSPGQTTLTEFPSGDFLLDSHFDTTFRVEFIGAPGSILDGLTADDTLQTTLQTLPVLPVPDPSPFLFPPFPPGTLTLPTGPFDPVGPPPLIPLPLTPPDPLGGGLPLPLPPTTFGLELQTQAVTIDPVVTFSGLSSTDSPTAGVRIVNMPGGGVKVEGDTNISNSANDGVQILNSTGEYTFGGGTISTGGGTTWRVEDGSASAAFQGNTNHNVAGTPAVKVQNHTGGTITFSNGTINATDGTGLEFDNADGNYNFDGIVTLNGGDAGIDILNDSAGTFTFANTSITNPTGTSLDVQDSSASVNLMGNITHNDAATAAVNIQNHTGGTITFSNGTVNATDGTGLQFDNADGNYNFEGIVTLNGGDAGIDILNDSAGTFTFANTTITDPTGTAFNAQNSAPDIDFGGTIIQNNIANGVVIENNTGDTITFNGPITINSGTTTGLSILNNSGLTVEFNDNVSFFIDASATIIQGNDNSTINFTSTVSIENTSVSGSIFIDANTGGTDITFSGPTTIGSSFGGEGVFMTNNGATGGAELNFSGTLDIDTTTGAGLSATGGGTVNATGANSTIDTTTGTAVRIENTDIGVDGLTLQNINTNGATNGILLDTTGTQGGLSITGDGTLNSGGTIQFSGGAGISLNDTASITFGDVTIENGASTTPAIVAANVDGLTLDRVTVNAGVNADSALDGANVRDLQIINGSVLDGGSGGVVFGANRFAVVMNNLMGVSIIDSSVIRNGKDSNLAIINDAATSADPALPDVLTIRNGTQLQNAAAFGNQIFVVANSNAGQNGNLLVEIDGGGTANQLFGTSSNAIVFESGGLARLGATVTDTQILNNTLAAIRGVAAENSVLKLHLHGLSGLTNTNTAAVIDLLNDSSIGGGGTPTLHATIENIHGVTPGDPGITVVGDFSNGIGAINAGDGSTIVDVNNVNVASNQQLTTGITMASVGGSGQLDAQVTGSIVNLINGLAGDGMVFIAGNNPGDTNTLRLNLENNDSTTLGLGNSYVLNQSMLTTTFQLQDFIGNGANAGDVVAWVNGPPKNNSDNNVGILTPPHNFTPTAGPVQTPMLPPDPPAPGVATDSGTDPFGVPVANGVTPTPSTAGQGSGQSGQGQQNSTNPDIIIDPNGGLGNGGTGINLGSGSGQGSPGAPLDAPPMVTITSPTNGTNIIEGTTFGLTVNATDDVAVQRVDLFADGVKIDTDFTFPFQFDFVFAPGVGLIQYDAVAVDSAGQMDTDAVTLNITQDQPPTVQFVSPTPGSTVVEGTSMIVEANANDDVKVQRVEFYVDGQLVDLDSTAPYIRGVQIPVCAGACTPVEIRVRAVDPAGNTADATRQVLRLDAGIQPNPLFTLPRLDAGTRIEFQFDTSILEVPPLPLPLPLPPNPPFGDPLLANHALLIADQFPLGIPSGDVQQDIIVGNDVGALAPQVRLFDNLDHEQLLAPISPYAGFNGGVRVAVGDVNGDGVADIITGTGPGGAPHVRVFDGATQSLIRDFLAFTPTYSGGVNVAVGDVNNDGVEDIITAAGGVGANNPGPLVQVFDGRDPVGQPLLHSFFAYDPAFLGGVTVGAADVNNDGIDDIITGAGPGTAGPHVKVFDGINGAEIRSFFAYPNAFNGGIFVAAGDVNNDGLTDIITAPGNGGTDNPGPHVRVFDGASSLPTPPQLGSFFAYDPIFTGGVRVAVGDMDRDGRNDIIVGSGPGIDSEVRFFITGRQGNTLRFDQRSAPITPFGSGYQDGIFVAGGRLNVETPTVTSVPSSDLRVEAVLPPLPVVAGETFMLTLDVINDGPSFGQNVRLATLVPSGTSLVNATSTSGTYDPGNGRLALGLLGPGVTESLTLELLVDPARVLPIRPLPLVTTTTHDPDPLNNVLMPLITVTQVTDLQLQGVVDFPDPVVAGQILTYEGEIINVGPSLATGAELLLFADPLLTLLPGQSTPGILLPLLPGDPFVLPLPPLGVNQLELFTAAFVLDPAATGPVNALIEVQTTQTDPNPNNNSQPLTTDVQRVDFGDLPDDAAGPLTGDPYPTLEAHNGARHFIVSDLQLGALVDNEADGQPTANADGDDTNNLDDDDGLVSIVDLQAGGNATVTVDVQGLAPTETAFINAFLDFDGVNGFGAGEQIATDLVVTANGNVAINFPVPIGAALGDTYMRIRLDSAGGLTAAGLALDGEVEDYRVTIEPPLDNLTLMVAPTVIVENDKVTLSGSFDGGPGAHTVTINWADGSSTVQTLGAGVHSFSFMHTYVDDLPSNTSLDIYSIFVEVEGPSGATIDDTRSVTVLNVPPTIISATITPNSLDEGQSVSLSGTFVDLGPNDTHLLSIDWDGDGTFDATVPAAGGTFNATHTYGNNGNFNAQLRLRDDDTGTTTRTIPVTVENVPPVADAGPDAQIPSGTFFTREFSFTDPGSDAPWTLTIDWGDGGTPTEIITVNRTANFAAHTYANPGLFTLTLTVDDGDDIATDVAAIQVGQSSAINPRIFYNNRVYDGLDPALNAADENAIDPTKVPAQEGVPTTYDNIISDSSFGFMVDLPAGANPTLGDVSTRVGTVNEVNAWQPGPNPTDILVRPGAGEAGRTRVHLLFDPVLFGAPTYFSVVLAPGATGLTQGQEFIYGINFGDTGVNLGTVDSVVDAFDWAPVSVRLGETNLPPEDPIDQNNDGDINSFDWLPTSVHFGKLLEQIVPSFVPVIPGVAEAPRVQPLAADEVLTADSALAALISISSDGRVGHSASDDERAWADYSLTTAEDPSATGDLLDLLAHQLAEA